MLLIELNEFNESLLQSVSDRLGLPNIRKFLNWNRVPVHTDDQYSSGFLEPWSQWVSVHTGVCASEHGVKHLGDVPNLLNEQIWEYWSDAGKSSIVWGVMNGARCDANNCKVFIPDPWTFSELAYPPSFNGLISLPRYLAKNSLKFSKLSAFLKGCSLFFTIARRVRFNDFLDAFKIFIDGVRRFGFSHIVFIVFFEYLSVMAFLKTSAKIDTDHQIVFINMIAHAQHHYWQVEDGSGCAEIDYTLQAIDDILGKLFEDVGGGEDLSKNISIINALSQKCTFDEPPWFLYVPKSHFTFISSLGINAKSVEPLMTYDAHVIFSSEEDMERGYDILNSVKIDGKSILYVERDSLSKCKLFYRVDYSKGVADGALMTSDTFSEEFYVVFEKVVQRTGKHIQESSLYCDQVNLTGRLYNHQIFDWLKAER